MVYSLRVVPHYKHRAALISFHNAVRECIESFLSCTFTDLEWSLASLSTRMGGLGLRSTELHSSGAFLASQAACHELCAKVDPNYSWDPHNPSLEIQTALDDYNIKVNIENQVQTTNNNIALQQILS